MKTISPDSTASTPTVISHPTENELAERAVLMDAIKQAMDATEDMTQKSILSLLLGFTIGYADSEPNITFWRGLFEQVRYGEIITIPGFAQAVPPHLRIDPLLKVATEPLVTPTHTSTPRARLAWQSLP